MSRGPRTAFRSNSTGVNASWVGVKFAIGTLNIARDPGPFLSNRIRSMAGSAPLDQRVWSLRLGLGLGFTQTIPGTILSACITVLRHVLHSQWPRTNSMRAGYPHQGSVKLFLILTLANAYCASVQLSENASPLVLNGRSYLCLGHDWPAAWMPLWTRRVPAAGIRTVQTP